MAQGFTYRAVHFFEALANDATVDKTVTPGGASPSKDKVDLWKIQNDGPDYAYVWVGGAAYAISAITAATPGVITTASAHPFKVGDKVFFSNILTGSMVELNNTWQTITVVADTTHFSIATTLGYTAFVAPGAGLCPALVTREAVGRILPTEAWELPSAGDQLRIRPATTAGTATVRGWGFKQ